MQTVAYSLTEHVKEQARRLGVHRFWNKPLPPANLRIRDASPEAIEADAVYGLNTGLSFYNQLRAVGLHPADKDILEIGPGTSYAGVAVLTAFGARGAVADRWLSPWQDDYHGPYYRRLADLLSGTKMGADVSCIKALADRGGYEGGAIELIPSEAEMLHKATSRRFDAVFSNAVLEHVLNIENSLEALYGLTRDGGHGFHQVDFRDHRNFDRPLDHLLYGKRVFNEMSKRVHMAYGSQHRPEDYTAAFEASGFEITRYHSNGSADEAYLDQLLPLLSKSRRSPHKATPKDKLRDLGGLFVVYRAMLQA